jgi:hypothetical protein
VEVDELAFQMARKVERLVVVVMEEIEEVRTEAGSWVE